MVALFAPLSGPGARRAKLALGSALLVAVALAAAGGSCTNPAADCRIEALGEENPEVPEGEFHRPGQPCVLCHDVYEGASPQLALGGTVFAKAYADVDEGDAEPLKPVAGVEVVINDALGQQRRAVTNCIGNFYFLYDDWQPQYPLSAEIRCPTYDSSGEPIVDDDGDPIVKVKKMGSYISRDGSCATCHTLAGQTTSSAGWIYCDASEEQVPGNYPDVADDCPGRVPDANPYPGITEELQLTCHGLQQEGAL